MPLSEGFHSNGSTKNGDPLKRRYSTATCSSGVKKQLEIDTDTLLIITSTGDKLFSGINIDDPERPSTQKIKCQ